MDEVEDEQDRTIPEDACAAVVEVDGDKLNVRVVMPEGTGLQDGDKPQVNYVLMALEALHEKMSG